MALKFAERGYNVVVAARQQERLEAVAEQVMMIRGKRDGAGTSQPYRPHKSASFKIDSAHN